MKKLFLLFLIFTMKMSTYVSAQNPALNAVNNTVFKWTKLLAGNLLPAGSDIRGVINTDDRTIYFLARPDILKFDIASGTLTSVSASNWPEDIGGGGYVYDKNSKRILYWLRGRGNVYSMPIEGGAWTQIGFDGTGDWSSFLSSYIFNPASQSPVLLNGYGSFTTKNWIYEFDFAAKRWTEKLANRLNIEPYPRVTQTAINGNGTKLYMFSGYGNATGDQNAGCSLDDRWADHVVGGFCWLKDLWELNLQNYQWTKLLSLNDTSVTREGLFAYYPSMNTFLNIGGCVPPTVAGGSYTSYTSDLFKYTPGTDAGFIKAAQSGEIPAPLQITEGIYTAGVLFDPAGDQLIVVRPDGFWSLKAEQQRQESDSYLHFNGNTYVTVPHNSTLNLGSAFTIEYWFTVEGPSLNDWIGIVSKTEDSHATYTGYRLGLGGFTPFNLTCDFFNLNGQGYSYGQPFIDVPSASQWHHIAVCSDGTNVRLFADGKLKDTKASPVVDNNTYPLTIGGQNGNYWNRNLVGSIDEVRISDIARYSSEFIPPVYLSTDSHTQALWHFNEGLGNIVNDVSSNKNNGTIVGAEWRTKPLPATVFQIKNAANETKNLNFGFHPAATNGMDPALGEETLPPMPPSEIMDARFEIPSNPVDYSMKDLRSDTCSAATWIMKFQSGSGGYPITLSWDISSLPEGNYTLKDRITGTIVNVNMKTQTGFTLTETDLTSLVIVYKKQTCTNIPVLSGWNIISVPLKAASMLPSSVLPGANSAVYGFNGSYIKGDTLSLSKGYWVRYPADQSISVCGQESAVNTISVNTGWNLIGIYNNSINPDSVKTVPAGILNSGFYGFVNGYVKSAMLLPGKGYWIRASQPGVINLSSAAMMSLPKSGTVANSNTAESVKKEYGRVRISDKNCRERVLLLVSGIQDIKQYDIPPVPPAGIFDARYITDRSAELAGTGEKEIIISSAEYPIMLKSEGMEINVKDRTGAIDRRLKDGEELIIANKEIDRLTIETAAIPDQYDLMQNYPNPFNPATTIRYTVPERTQVTLTVYNQLGERVRELENTVKDAGEYRVEFNAQGLSSGVYFYEIKTPEFQNTKKLLLIK